MNEHLVERLHRATAIMSSTSAMRDTPEFSAVVNEGRAVLPALFDDLEKDPSAVVMIALAAITGQNPVKVQDRGHIKRMAESWLDMRDVL